MAWLRSSHSLEIHYLPSGLSETEAVHDYRPSEATVQPKSDSALRECAATKIYALREGSFNEICGKVRLKEPLSGNESALLIVSDP